jgi:hypothetical protein
MLRIVRKKLRDVNAEDKPETSRPVSRKYIEDGDKDKNVDEELGIKKEVYDE